jgi:hypothetical protein
MAQYDCFKSCGHGKRYAERCIECETVSAREGLGWAKRDLEHYEMKLRLLEAEKTTLISDM